MTRRALPDRIERGGAMVCALLNAIFRAFVLLLFLPLAWRAIMSGDLAAAGAMLAFAFAVGALLAPSS